MKNGDLLACVWHSYSKCELNAMTNHSFDTLTHTSPVFGSLSIFLCSSASLSPLPLVFRSQPTLSVGRRDRRCLANAPAGSVLVLVSISACKCKSTHTNGHYQRCNQMAAHLWHMVGCLENLNIVSKSSWNRKGCCSRICHYLTKSIFTWKEPFTLLSCRECTYKKNVPLKWYGSIRDGNIFQI